MAHVYDAAILPPLTLSERYTHAQSINFIFHEIGLTNPERVRLINDGMISVQALVNMYGHNIKDFRTYLEGLNKTFASASVAANRVYYTPVIISKLMGVLFYFSHCVETLHRMPDVLSVDNAFIIENYEHWKSFPKEVDTDEDSEDIIIPKLKGHENWVQWRDAFIASLGNIIGGRGIPIDYVIDMTLRDATRGNATRTDYLVINLEDDGIFLTQSVHFGPMFKLDNTKVWKLLKSSLINTPPYNNISNHNGSKDGRAAWKSLLAAYQGSDYTERMRDSAFEVLSKSHYNGEKKTFNFEKFVDIHKAAHKKLIDAEYNGGRGLDEETKIQHLKNGIKAEAGLEHALSIISLDNRYRNDFDGFTSYMMSQVNRRNDRSKQLSTTSHRVAALGRGGFRGGRGGGRGRGRNSGRGQPDHIKWAGKPSRVVGGKTVYGVHYPSHRFATMSGEQKTAIAELRRQANANRTNVSSVSSVITTDDIANLESRIISAVQRGYAEANDDASVLTPDTTRNNGSKRKANAGSVGSFMASQNKRGKNNESE